MAQTKKHGTLYVMHAKLCKDEENVAADSSGEIWHKRFGHWGGQYFVTFIDDYGWKLSAFVLKSKDQVLSYLKELQARAERESSRNLKVVWTDNGGEYRGKFEEYCKPQGIQI